MEPKGIDRRTFVGAMGAPSARWRRPARAWGAQPGAAVAAGQRLPRIETRPAPSRAKVDPKTGEVTVNEDVIVRNMTCVGCYESCGNRIKLDRETGAGSSAWGGNPYHPKCAYPPLPFEAPLEEEYRSFSYGAGMGNQLRGTICGVATARWMPSQPTPRASPRP